jgi:hypothetical protein
MQNGDTALHIASGKAFTASVWYLVEGKAALNMQNEVLQVILRAFVFMQDY